LNIFKDNLSGIGALKRNYREELECSIFLDESFLMGKFTKFLKGEDDVLLCMSKKYKNVILTPTTNINLLNIASSRII